MGAINRKHTHTSAGVSCKSGLWHVKSWPGRSSVLQKQGWTQKQCSKFICLRRHLYEGGGNQNDEFPSRSALFAAIRCSIADAAILTWYSRQVNRTGFLQGFLLWKPFEVGGPCEGRYKSDWRCGASLTEMFEFKHTNTWNKPFKQDLDLWILFPSYLTWDVLESLSHRLFLLLIQWISELLYSERMNSVAMPSSSLSRHSVSASLVPTDSPKRSGQLHQTQVGKMKLRGQKCVSLTWSACAIPTNDFCTAPVCLFCSFSTW